MSSGWPISRQVSTVIGMMFTASLVILVLISGGVWIGSHFVGLRRTAGVQFERYDPVRNNLHVVGFYCYEGTAYLSSIHFLEMPELASWTQSGLNVRAAKLDGFTPGAFAVFRGNHGDSVWNRLGFGFREAPLQRRQAFTGERTVWFPLGLPTAVLGGLLTYRLLMIRKQRRLLQSGCCTSCGYDLRASRERCPECGAPFEPSPNAEPIQSRSDDIK